MRKYCANFLTTEIGSSSPQWCRRPRFKPCNAGLALQGMSCFSRQGMCTFYWFSQVDDKHTRLPCGRKESNVDQHPLGIHLLAAEYSIERRTVKEKKTNTYVYICTHIYMYSLTIILYIDRQISVFISISISFICHLSSTYLSIE